MYIYTFLLRMTDTMTFPHGTSCIFKGDVNGTVQTDSTITFRLRTLLHQRKTDDEIPLPQYETVEYISSL
jgi:hypothetical protein